MWLAPIVLGWDWLTNYMIKCVLNGSRYKLQAYVKQHQANNSYANLKPTNVY